jgi:hypothetical protein
MIARAASVLILLAPFAATGCEQSPVAGARAAAEATCLDRFSKIIHPAADNIATTDDDPDDNVSADNEPAFHINTTGQFAVDFPPIANLSHPYKLRCTGDINERLLTSVQIDGVLHRPKPSEKWAF